jgi:hypothetical protein
MVRISVDRRHSLGGKRAIDLRRTARKAAPHKCQQQPADLLCLVERMVVERMASNNDGVRRRIS